MQRKQHCHIPPENEGKQVQYVRSIDCGDRRKLNSTPTNDITQGCRFDWNLRSPTDVQNYVKPLEWNV